MKWYEYAGAGKPLYYLHLLIIVLITYGLLALFGRGNMFSLNTIALGVLLVGVSDVAAHFILRIH